MLASRKILDSGSRTVVQAKRNTRGFASLRYTIRDCKCKRQLVNTCLDTRVARLLEMQFYDTRRCLHRKSRFSWRSFHCVALAHLMLVNVLSGCKCLSLFVLLSIQSHHAPHWNEQAIAARLAHTRRASLPF